ncbi:MAG: 7-carboxy-7-deazaguanine synthase QueE [Cyanobacteria bacterium P01_F01_bin.150]
MNVLFPIHETFQSTVQGEGALAGTLVDFIRLYGCPVGCWFCDTGYSHTDNHGRTIPYTQYTIEQLLAELRSPRVVISGGEPMMNRHLPLLINAIETSDRQVSIETSGSRWQSVNDTVWLTLSPKEHVNQKFPVIPKLWSRANEIKLVISDGRELEFYQESLKKVTGTVYLQPEWADNQRTLPLTLQLLQKHPHYRLSVQLHKLIGVP